MIIKILDGPAKGSINVDEDLVLQYLTKGSFYIYSQVPYYHCIYKLNEDLTATFLENVRKTTASGNY